MPPTHVRATIVAPTGQKGTSMATTTPRRTSVPADEYSADGWISFAAIVLFVAAFFSSMWGLAAILNDQVVTVGGRGVTVLDFTTWGWAHLILGAMMGLTGVGLLGGRGWARWVAVILVTLNAFGQVGVISAFPLWALMMVALDVVVIYHLTARWVHVDR
jgi:hypothetical protein